MATPVGALAAAAAQQQQTKPASAAATQQRRPSRADQNKVLNKELLDADMDIYKQSHTGGDTSELEKKLESLQSQVPTQCCVDCIDVLILSNTSVFCQTHRGIINDAYMQYNYMHRVNHNKPL